jgi:hypothetical protein
VSVEFQLDVVRPERNARIGSALGYRDSARDIADQLAIVEYRDGVSNGSLDVGGAGGPYSKDQTSYRYSCAKYCHTIHLAPLRHFSEKIAVFRLREIATKVRPVLLLGIVGKIFIQRKEG